MPSKVALREQAHARFKQLYEELNPEQRAAVDAIEGCVMVLAGPGTGKTQLLAMRIANILHETQMDPWNILCVTFTESGVVAMRERLLSIIGEPAYYVRIHTFHSFANEIIQEHPDIFAKARTWQPLSDVERVQLIESLLDELPGTSPLKPFGHPYLYVRDITSNIQALKQEELNPEAFRETLTTLTAYLKESAPALQTFCDLKPSERTSERCDELAEDLRTAAETVHLSGSLLTVIDSFFVSYRERAGRVETARAASMLRTALKNEVKRWHDRLQRDLPRHRDLALVFERYGSRLEEQGRYDFEDMIAHVVGAFRNNPDLLADYQEQFQYILVDEYQDTNGAQNELVYLLGSFDERPNLFVVGDDKQSIYRFQGASLSNMLDFYRRYEEHVQIVSLRENYRSQPHILTAAQAVIEHNQARLPAYIPGVVSELVPRAQRGEEMLVCSVVPNEAAEEALVAERVARLLESGVALESVAVIFRYHRDGVGILNALRTRGLPVRLESGEDALSDQFVRQFLTLLEYILWPEHEEILGHLLFYDWLKFDPVAVVSILHEAHRTRRSLWALMSESSVFQEFGRRLASWQARAHNTTLQDFLHVVLTESGLLDYVTNQHDCLGALQHLTRILEEARQMNAASHTLAPRDFLQALRLLQQHEIPLTTRPWQVADQAVRLLTAHKAKGLQFEHVFIIRLNDKHWGNNREPARLMLPHGLVQYDFVADRANNEDERRLFYVAMTRAQQSLTLTRATHTAQGRPVVPSLFLQEIPAGILVTEERREEPAVEQERLLRDFRPLPAVTQRELRSWLREQLRHYVFSVTHLTNYVACPRRFYFRNLLRVPSARTTYQALGTAVHGALEEMVRRWEREGRQPSAAAASKDFERYLQQEILTPAQWRDVYDTGVKYLQGYMNHYRPAISAAVRGEYSFQPHRVVVDGIPITGTIDKIEWLLDKDQEPVREWPDGACVNVVDYKTGQPDGKAAALRSGGDYHRQLAFYKLLCDESPQFPYEMVSGEIDFIQPNRQGRFVKKRIVLTAEDVGEVRENLRRVWAEIQALHFLDPNVGCGECEYCVSD